ncbi:hypothetical protein BJ875DRAFT_489498 [Amylocarpus encephaloides]|uniref:Zn(2)-C6 fungal-type domain-containing protein n=1 Tax=Amylocarpus encephaloides TaxID=45428 RepID=A0A9P8C0F6_9HELO|nr:hypothetical protein BJ875DRAFT_489498 [Amylocarpus encephaloides]
MQSYPSPNAIAADGAAPFYSSATSQHHPALSNPDDLQLIAQSSRGLVPNMNAGAAASMADAQDTSSPDALNQQYGQGQEQEANHHVAPIASIHSAGDHMGAQYTGGDGSTAPRKRSKVSRACDECRRKKIRCDATGEVGDDQCSSCKRVGARCQFSRVPMKRGPSKGYIKELADRLQNLEGAIHAGDPSPPTYLGHGENEMPRRPSDEFSPPPPHGDNQLRKRTFSNMSADFGNQYQLQRPASGYGAQDTPRHMQDASSAFATQTAPVPQMFREPNYSPSGLAPSAHWRKAPEATARQSSAFEGMQSAEVAQGEQCQDWDEDTVARYYASIHPVYPILSHASTRLRPLLSNCPGPLKDAFFESLHAAVQSFNSSAKQPLGHQSVKKAAQLIVMAQFEVASARPMSFNLIYLQTMLLMAIAAENHAWTVQSGLSRSVWISSAVSLAYDLKLHKQGLGQAVTSDPDSEENLTRRLWWSAVVMDRWHASSISCPLLIPDESVVFHPEDQVVLRDVYHVARLSVILGHFVIASLAAEDLPQLASRPVQIVDTLLRGELERWRETLPTPLSNPSNVILMCYWHVRMLLELRLTEPDASELLTIASSISNLASQNPDLSTPLTYHTTGLSALVLVHLTSVEKTKDMAGGAILALLDSRLVPPGSDNIIREMTNKKKHLSNQTSGSTATIDLESQAMTANLGLRRLADIATAAEGSSDAMADIQNEGEKSARLGHDTLSSCRQELKAAIKSGYLNILSTESNR